MHSTSTLFDTIREVPAWAGDLRLEDYRAFLMLVDAELTRRAMLPYQFDDGTIVRLSPAHKGQRLSVHTLLTVCRTQARARWAHEIATFFSSIERGITNVTALMAQVGDFEAVRGLLRVRLNAPEAPTLPGGAGLVHQMLAPGLRAILVYDVGNAVVSVMPEHAQGWGQSFDALLALALRNVGTLVEVERHVLEVAPQRSIITLWGSSNSSSSHALLLDQHLDPSATLGALVVVPARHGVVFLPILDPGAVDQAGYLLDLAAMMYANEPGPISRELYWWHAGRLMHLPTERHGSVVALSPPEAFEATVLGAVDRRLD